MEDVEDAVNARRDLESWLGQNIILNTSTNED